jgi:hypothetical protein
MLYQQAQPQGARTTARSGGNGHDPGSTRRSDDAIDAEFEVK